MPIIKATNAMMQLARTETGTSAHLTVESPVISESIPPRVREGSPLGSSNFSQFFSFPRVALLLGALILLCFYDVLLGSRTFVIRDYGVFAYPVVEYQRASFWNGEVPLWNPLNNCGTPLLAQWSTSTLYPLSVLYLLLPLPWSLSFFCLAHLWFAGLGMYLLARAWTGNNLSAAVAAMGFVFNGFTLNCLMWPNNIAALTWMPWVVWLVVQSWSQGGWRQLIWAALAGAMQMLSGAPEVILLTWVSLGILWLKQLCWPSDREGRPLLQLPIIIVLIALLSAAQLLPFFDFLAHSQRDLNFADNTWSMPPWGWANFLVPLFRCYLAGNGVYYQTGQGWTSSYYSGIVILFLAFCALFRLRDARLRTLCGLSLICLLLALGDYSFVYPLLRKGLPQLGFMRFPIKFIIVPMFVFPLLGGEGAKRIIESFERSEKHLLKWAGALMILGTAGIVAILCFAHSHLLANENWAVLARSGVSRIIILALAFGAVWAFGKKPLQKAAAIFLFLLVPVDALTHAPSQNPTISGDAYAPGVTSAKMTPAPKPGVSRAMMTRPTHDALYGQMLRDPAADYIGRRLGLFGNTSLLDRIPNVDGFFSLYLRESREVWEHLFFRQSTNNSPLADFLAISQVSDPKEFLAWQSRSNYMPMITVGQKAIFKDDAQAFAAITSHDFQPREVVFLPESARGSVSGTNQSTGQLSDLRFSAHKIEFKADAPDRTMLVVSQAYDHNWHAYLEGRRVPIWRANYAFQAIDLAPGQNKVVLRYENAAFRTGSLLSVLTAGGCLASLLALRYGGRPGQAH
jgi:hypothetical protein